MSSQKQIISNRRSASTNPDEKRPSQPRFTQVQQNLIQYAISCEVKEVNRLFTEIKQDDSKENCLRISAILTASLRDDIIPDDRSHVSNNDADSSKRVALKSLKRTLSRTHKMPQDEMNEIIDKQSYRYREAPLTDEFSQIQIITSALQENTALKKSIMKRYRDEQSYIASVKEMRDLFNGNPEDNTLALQTQMQKQQERFQQLIDLGKKKQVLMKGSYHEINVDGETMTTTSTSPSPLLHQKQDAWHTKYNDTDKNGLPILKVADEKQSVTVTAGDKSPLVKKVSEKSSKLDKKARDQVVGVKDPSKLSRRERLKTHVKDKWDDSASSQSSASDGCSGDSDDNGNDYDHQNSKQIGQSSSSSSSSSDSESELDLEQSTIATTPPTQNDHVALAQQKLQQKQAKNIAVAKLLPPWLQRPIYLDPALSISLDYLNKHQAPSFATGPSTPFTSNTTLPLVTDNNTTIDKASQYKLQPFALHPSLISALQSLKIMALLPAQIALLSHLSTPFQPLNNPQLVGCASRFDGSRGLTNTMASSSTKSLPQSSSKVDICVCSPTGTGKTLAYLLPTINNILQTTSLGPKQRTMSTLIIVPTQPLANQVYTVCSQLLSHINNTTTNIQNGNGKQQYYYPLKCYLGTPQNAPDALSSSDPKQSATKSPYSTVGSTTNSLGEADIVILTPGRTIDFLSTSSVFQQSLPKLSYLIFDECDSILNSPSSLWLVHLITQIENGGGKQSRHASSVTKMLFSATFTGSPPHMALLGLKSPIYFAFRPSTTVKTIKVDNTGQIQQINTVIEGTTMGGENDEDLMAKDSSDDIDVGTNDSDKDSENDIDGDVGILPTKNEKSTTPQQQPQTLQQQQQDSSELPTGKSKYVLPTALELEYISVTKMSRPSTLYGCITYAQTLHRHLQRILATSNKTDTSNRDVGFRQKTTITPHCGVLVFVSTLDTSHRLRRALELFSLNQLRVAELTGHYNPQERSRILNGFDADRNDGRYYDVLICSDMVSRGIDLKSAFMVVNYDFPNDSASFCHRVGRCARGSNFGLAVTLLYDAQFSYYRKMLGSVQYNEPKSLFRHHFHWSVAQPSLPTPLSSSKFAFTAIRRGLECKDGHYFLKSSDFYLKLFKKSLSKESVLNENTIVLTQRNFQFLVSFEQLIANMAAHLPYFTQSTSMAKFFLNEPEGKDGVKGMFINEKTSNLNFTPPSLPVEHLSAVYDSGSISHRLEQTISVLLPALIQWEQDHPTLPNTFNRPPIEKNDLVSLFHLASKHGQDPSDDYYELFHGLVEIMDNIIDISQMKTFKSKQPINTQLDSLGESLTKAVEDTKPFNGSQNEIEEVPSMSFEETPPLIKHGQSKMTRDNSNKIKIQTLPSSSSSSSSPSASLSDSNDFGSDDHDHHEVIEVQQLQKDQPRAPQKSAKVPKQPSPQVPRGPPKQLRWESSDSSSSSDGDFFVDSESSENDSAARAFAFKAPIAPQRISKKRQAELALLDHETYMANRAIRLAGIFGPKDNGYDRVDKFAKFQEKSQPKKLEEKPSFARPPLSSTSSSSSDDEDAEQGATATNNTNLRLLSVKQQRKMDDDSLNEAIKRFEDAQYLRSLQKKAGPSCVSTTSQPSSLSLIPLVPVAPTIRKVVGGAGMVSGLRSAPPIMDDLVTMVPKKQKVKDDDDDDLDISKLMSMSSQKKSNTNFGDKSEYTAKRW